MTTIESRTFGSPSVQQMLLAWWESLEENRGDRAELRRCRTPDEVLLTEAYHKVRRRFVGAKVDFRDRRLGAVVGLLSHVRTHKPAEFGSLGSAMAATKKESDSAKVSGLRFRRILQIEDYDKLYDRLIGVIRLLDGVVDVRVLSKDVFYWSADSDNGVRRRWATDYYSQAPEEA